MIDAEDDVVYSAGGRRRPTAPTADQVRAADALRETLERSEALTARVEAVSARLAWDSESWFKVALLGLPYAVVLIALVALAVPVSAILGIPSLSAWAWSSFETAESAWGRAGIGVTTVAVVAGLVYGIYRGGRWLTAKYQAAVSK